MSTTTAAAATAAATNLHDTHASSSDRRDSSSSKNRYESFTEAVPLALSSMAHVSVFSQNRGVLDGLCQMLQHTMWQSVNYARSIYNDMEFTVSDLEMGQHGWMPIKEHVTHLDLQIPLPLAKLKFQHCYSRNALIYLKEPFANGVTVEQVDGKDVEQINNWMNRSNILARIRLLYATTEPLTKGEMDGSDRDEDMPTCLLYRILVEYKTLPATGNPQAKLAEELSMLSFGGSVDDELKYGALASLYDETAKYVLEIYGVRGKKYKFDLMDATLSDGTVPSLPASRNGDSFAKSLCVTVTNHDLYKELDSGETGATNDAATNGGVEQVVSSTNRPKFAITRMSLLLEGKPRKGSDFSSIPGFDDVVNGIAESFLLLNPKPPSMVTALPSGHVLLLDPSMAGRIYVNGRYVTTWASDARIGSHGVALFGMDLHSIPLWHGRIVDFEALKAAYATMWSEILVDARLADLNVATKLLHRLLLGRDRADDEELYDDDDESMKDDRAVPVVDVNCDCLESQVLASAQFDPVGIAAKALATKFAAEFGKDAFPCASHETEWVRSALPHRKPVSTPSRLMKILRRGGYFDTQTTIDELWMTQVCSPKKGPEQDLVNAALQLLEQAGCADVDLEQICLASLATTGDCVLKKLVCRYSAQEQTYFIHDKLLDMTVNDYIDNENQAAMDPAKVKAYLLGMFIAKEHPDGRVLPRYLLRVSL
ncbi:hypothetical protein MPSEU_000172800 [Mayamaea pseudoterrestris]|nr:hypothetical protein MPSEU_000172800 [Mayamaea pseudoterrestris]